MSWNIHPGEMLQEEFMNPLNLNARQLSKLLGVPPPRINDILLEKRGITADTALRLAHYFGTTARFWMNLQATYELKNAEKEINELLVTLLVCTDRPQIER